MSEGEVTDVRDLALKAGVGFLATIVVFCIVFFLVGIDDILRQFRSADAKVLPLLILTGGGWLISWSMTLRTVLQALGQRVSRLSAILMYNSAVFANNVTPFGQAGGEPVTAAIFSNRLDTPYERGLAAIASVDMINFFPSLGFAVIGIGYFATQITFNGRIELAVVTLVVLGGGVISGLVLSWHHRDWIESELVPKIATALHRVGSHVPLIDAPTEEELMKRSKTFISSIEEVGQDDASLSRSLVFSALGWAFQMVTLWLSFYAINAPIPLSVPLFVIPVSVMASVSPLPGGTGGIEAVLIALIGSITPLGLPTATAGVLLFRGVIYWLPLMTGSFAVGAVLIRE